MDNLIASLAVFAGVVLGWFASLSLLVQFVVSQRRRRRHLAWSVLWGVGWGTFIVDVILITYRPADRPSWQEITGNISVELASAVWLCSWCVHKWMRRTVMDHGPDTGAAPGPRLEDVWPRRRGNEEERSVGNDAVPTAPEMPRELRDQEQISSVPLVENRPLIRVFSGIVSPSRQGYGLCFVS